MTTTATFGSCNQCGNDALLLEGNGGTCLGCLLPKPEPYTFEGQFIEGCDCPACEEFFQKSS